MTPVAKRQAVAHLCSSFEVSQRRACDVIGADRSSVRYLSLRPGDAVIRARLRELAHNSEVLIVREPGSGTREVVSQALAAHGVEPLRTLEIGSTAAIKQVVAAGLGVSIVSAVTVRDQVQLGYLKIVAIRDVTIERTLWQLKLPGRTAMPAARVFEQMLADRKTFPDERSD